MFAMPTGYGRLASLRRLYRITHFSVPQSTGLKCQFSGKVQNQWYLISMRRFGSSFVRAFLALSL